MNIKCARPALLIAAAMGLCVVASSCTHARVGGTRKFEGVTYQGQSGDLAAFFLKQACAYGARPKTNATTSTVRTSWEFATVPDGFQINLRRGDVDRLVNAALVPAFGEPSRSSSCPHIYYGPRHIGVALIINTNEATCMMWAGTTNCHLKCLGGEKTLKWFGD
jgi:hypothetical protein